MPFELLARYPVEFAIIVLSGAGAIYILSRAGEGVLAYLKDVLTALLSEVRSRSPSRRAAAINLTMLFVSGALAFVIALPSLAAQLGITSDPNGIWPLVGPSLFVVISLISAHFCLSVEKQYPAFKDEPRSSAPRAEPEQEAPKSPPAPS